MSVEARIHKRLPPFELHIELRAAPGITVLLGPSGSGKTLTLNCLAGFTRPDDGRILVDEQIYFDAATRIHVPPQQRRCGYLFQEHALFPHMTVRENLRFAAASQKQRGLNTRRRINDLLEAFELGDLAKRKPARLSGGEKQRAALARMLVGEPRLILLDEPTRGLDVRLRQSFYEIVRETRNRLNIPFLLVTHDLEECFELADAVCLMEGGRFLQTGSAEAVLTKPVSVAAAQFLGTFVVLPAEIAALDPSRNTSRLRVGDADVEGPYLPGHLIGDHGSLCVRTSEVTVGAASHRGGDLTLAVSHVFPAPNGVRILFDGGATVTISETEFEPLRRLPRLALRIPSNAVNFLAG